jgi:DNA-binding NtrC family response regulator
MSRSQSVLVVDDEDFVRESLADLLESEGYLVLKAGGPAEALATLAAQTPHLIVTDLSMPDGTGLDLLREVRKQDTTTPIILLTGVGTVTDAVAAIKAGAYDFIQKPVEPDQFVLLVERALEHRRLVAQVEALRTTVQDLRAPGELVGESEWHAELRSTIAQVAASEATVLISGPSGTGKELVATEIHRLSERSSGNLVKVNCAALTEALFESELFGHRAGAIEGATMDRIGRFEEADGGTLVLDEVGNLKLDMQAKLLRVLESGEYQVLGESRTRFADVRIVAITNEDLEARVQDGTFRSDLYYRLNIFPIRMQPLVEHPEDIAVIARYYLRRATATRDPSSVTRRAPELPAEAVAALRGYDWPGNARELRNVIERALILRPGAELDGELFRRLLNIDSRRSTGGGGLGEEVIGDDLNLRNRTDALEARLIQVALERTGGKKRDAAALLGIDPKNLGYYLRKHEIG